MEELLALRAALEKHRYADAFAILGELEEMSKDDKIEKIYSYMVILLVHLIKQQAEERTTNAIKLRTSCHSHESGNPCFQVIVDSRLHGNDANLMALERTTRFWELSIHESVKKIRRVNKRRKSSRYYLSESELQENLTDAYSNALKMASLEAFNGQYTEEQLAQKINNELIEKIALELILEGST